MNRSTPAVSPRIFAAVSGPTPTTASSGGRELVDSGLDLGVQLVDLTVKVRSVLDQLAGEAGDEGAGVGQRVQVGFDGVVGAGSVQGPGRGLPGRVELVQVPSQSSDDPGSFCDKVFAVVDQ